MKNLKSIVVAFALCAFSSSVFGQQSVTPVALTVPMGLPMLSSKAALRIFAIESARATFLELSSPGMINPSWSTGTGWSDSLKVQEVLNHFNALKITIPMANVEDYVHATATINTLMGRTLFTAESWSKPSLVKGGYELPQMWFGFTIAKFVPVKLDRSIHTARARYINDYGQTVGDPINLDVVNGELEFQSDLAGQVILELWDNNANAYEYDLRQPDGRRINVEQVAYNGSMSYLDGVYGLTDPSTIDWNVWSWNGIGQNPAFEVTVTAKGWLPISVHSNEDATAIGYLLRAKDAADWTQYPVATGAKFGQLPMLPGVWYIVPVWNPSEFKEPAPDIGGGGGKG